MTNTGHPMMNSEGEHGYSDRQELEIKNALAGFIRTHFVLEGQPVLVDHLVRDISVDLFELFLAIQKSYPQKK